MQCGLLFFCHRSPPSPLLARPTCGFESWPLKFVCMCVRCVKSDDKVAAAQVMTQRKVGLGACELVPLRRVRSNSHTACSAEIEKLQPLNECGAK
jgi:hypothetical protein